MSGQIFISYRRDDTSASAGRLYDRLSSHFPSNRIFIDVDNIAPGVDFVEAIEKSVGSCDLLISVIGKNWLTSSDDEGKRRLDNPEDFVRLEIGAALRRNIRVIPVLVEGASIQFALCRRTIRLKTSSPFCVPGIPADEWPPFFSPPPGVGRVVGSEENHFESPHTIKPPETNVRRTAARINARQRIDY